MTETMNTFVESISSHPDRSCILPLIQSFFQEKGEAFVNIKDSCGNCLIHHICTLFSDKQEKQFTEIVRYLLNPVGSNEQKTKEAQQANFMKMMASKLDISKDDLSDMGLNPDNKDLTFILNINQGNSVGQSPLHLLSGLKKEALLLIFLDTVFSGNPHLLNFSPNVQESTERTFMHILLEKGLLQTFEVVARKYGQHLDLERKDMFGNSILMTYMRLKNEQLHKLKSNYQYDDLLQAILEADLTAYKDIRNVIFDRELGTNLLSDLATKDKADEFLKLLKVLQKLKDSFEIGCLYNVPSQDGSTVTMKVLQQFSFKQIDKYLSIVQIKNITYYTNSETNQNLFHYLYQNRQLLPKEISHLNSLLFIIVDKNDLLNQVDNFDHIPVNYLIINSDKSLEDSYQLIKEVLTLTNLKQFTDFSYIERQQDLREVMTKRYHELKKECMNTSKDQYQHENHGDSKKCKYCSKYSNATELMTKKLKKLKKIEKQLVKAINPLEIAINATNLQVILMLVQEFNISPFQQSSMSFQQAIIERAFHQNKIVEIVTMCIQNTQDKQFIQNLEFIKCQLRINKQITDYEIEKDINPDFQIDKARQLLSQISGLLSPSDYKSLLFDILPSSKSDSGDISQSEKCQDKVNQQINNISSFESIAVFSTSQQCKSLLINLKPIFIELQQDQLKIIYFKMYKEVFKRHSIQMIDFLVQQFPDSVDLLFNNNDQDILSKLSKAMYQRFKDIQCPNFIQWIREKHNIIIVPNFDVPENKLKKDERYQNYKKIKYVTQDKRYIKIGQKQQKELQKQMKEESFIHMINLIKSNSLQKTKLPNIADIFLQSPSKLHYLRQLLQEQVLFSLLDLKIDTHQKTIQTFINQLLKSGEFPLAIEVFKQLKEYLKTKCSLYPLNYFSEINQFENNHPYKEFKLQSFIRQINYASDKYPIYLGQDDTGDINDENEEQLQEMWQQLNNGNNTVNETNNILVPNGHAIMFKMFAQMSSAKINVNLKNYNEFQEIYKYVIDFGGFPHIDIQNLHDKNSNLEYSQKKNLIDQSKLILKFSQCLKQKSFQTILHQISNDPYFDIDTLKYICSSESLQQENFNSKDSAGKTPISLALQNKNFKFLEIALTQSSTAFVQNNQEFHDTLQKVFNNSNVEEQVTVLSLIAKNIQKSKSQFKEKLYQQNNDLINKKLNSLYESESQNKKDFADQELNCFKILRAHLKTLPQQLSDPNFSKTLIYGLQMTQFYDFGQFIYQLGFSITIDQIKELESYGYNLCNSINYSDKNCKLLQSKVLPIHQFFPFQSSSKQLSYLLKYVMLSQPENKELISYIFNRMDMTLWKPFLFEIMVFVGRIYGTKNEYFQKLFIKEKAYLMGRFLTVETRLKSFSESNLPQAANLYYKELNYRNMLTQLADILIKNHEKEMFTTFINDQSRFYLSISLIQTSLESCCRNFEPRLAILAAAVGFQQNFRCIDYANLMPDIDTKVTISEVEETSVIARATQIFSSRCFFNMISRDMMDQFVNYTIQCNTIGYLLNVNNDEKWTEWEIELLKQIYIKSSPPTIVSLISHLKGYITSQTCLIRLMRHLLSFPNQMFESVSKTAFSKTHKSIKAMQMKTYLQNQMDKLSMDKAYYDIIQNPHMEQEILDRLGINDKVLQEIRELSRDYRDDFLRLKDVRYTFGDYQTITGLYRLKGSSLTNNKNSSVKDFQSLSSEDIKSLSEQELCLQTENLVLLYEYLVNQDQRRQTNQAVVQQKDNGNNSAIKNRNIRDAIQQAQKPQKVNLSMMFKTGDTAIVHNDFEEILLFRKMDAVEAIIDVEKLTQKEIKKLQKAKQSYLFSMSAKSKPFRLDLDIKLQKKLEEICIPTLSSLQFNDENNNNQANPNVISLSREDYIRELFSKRVEIQDSIKKAIAQNRTNIKQYNQAMRYLEMFLTYKDIQMLFQVEALVEDTLNDLNRSILTLFSENHDLFQSLKATLFEPLISNTSSLFSFVFSDDFPIEKKQYFYCYICVCFAHDEEQLQTQILQNKQIMENMSIAFKQWVFCVLVSKSYPYIDRLLIMMREYMTDQADRIAQFQQDDAVRLFKVKYQPVSCIINPNMTNVTVSSLLAYLIRSKRLNVFKQYQGDIEVTANEYFIAVKYASYDKGFMQWFVEELGQGLVDPLEYPRLIYWLLMNTDFETVALIDKSYNCTLLQNDIDYCTNHLEDGKDALIPNLIHHKCYDQVRFLHKYASPDQWQKIAHATVIYSNPVNQDDNWGEEVKEEDQVHQRISPFAYALVNCQFQIARMLFPKEQMLQSITIMDIKLIISFLKNHAMNGLHQSDKQSDEQIQAFNLRFQKEDQKRLGFKKPEACLNSTKILLSVPQIFNLFHSVFSNEQKAEFQTIISRDIGVFAEIDAFYYRFGLGFNALKMFKHDKTKEYTLFTIEKGFNIKKYIGNTKVNNKEMLTQPYSYFVQRGFFEKLYDDQMFQTKEIQEVETEMEQVIEEKQESIINEMFGHQMVNDVFTGFAHDRFELSYYLLTVQKELQIVQDINLNTFQKSIWLLNFDSFSKDLIILSQIQSLFPDKLIFAQRQDVILTEEEQSQEYNCFSHQYFTGIQQCNKRSLALLIYLLNHYTVQELFPNNKGQLNSPGQVIEHFFKHYDLQNPSLSKSFKHLNDKVQMLREAIKIYQDNNKELTNMCKQLDYDQAKGFKMQQNYLSDLLLRKTIEEITNLKENNVFEDGFNFSINVEHPIAAVVQQYEQYGQTIGYCKFIIELINEFVIILSQDMPANVQLRISLESHSQFISINKLEPLKFICSYPLKGIQDQQKVIDFKEEIIYQYNLDIIQTFIEKGKKDILKQFKLLQDLQFDLIYQQEFQKSINLIEAQALVQKIKKKSNNSLVDVIVQNFSAYALKESVLQAKFKQIRIEFMTYEEVQKDLQINYPKYVLESCTHDITKDETVLILYADPVANKIGIHQGACQPLCRLQNQSLTKEFISNLFSLQRITKEVQSGYNCIPPILLSYDCLYTVSDKICQIDQIAHNIFKNPHIIETLQTAIMNLVQQHQKELPGIEKFKKDFKLKRQYGEYNQIKEIVLTFRQDKGKRSYEECVEPHINREQIQWYVSDVHFSTEKVEKGEMIESIKEQQAKMYEKMDYLRPFKKHDKNDAREELNPVDKKSLRGYITLCLSENN